MTEVLCNISKYVHLFTARSFLSLAQPPKIDSHLLSAVCDCLFNTFATALHSLEAVLSIRNLRTKHVVVPGTHLTRYDSTYFNVAIF